MLQVSCLNELYDQHSVHTKINIINLLSWWVYATNNSGAWTCTQLL